MALFPAGSTSNISISSQSYNPANAETSTVWALARSLATTYAIIFYFLFLWVLRCFSSPRSLIFRCDRSSTGRVAPFGYPGINGYLHLHRVFRSLSRPSSPPRAKASTVCPSLTFFTFLYHTTKLLITNYES